MAFGGKGVARHDGKVYFVRDTVPGDRVQVRITKEHEKYCDAEVEVLLQESSMRGKSECPYFRTCGGCDWHGIDYQQQLIWKKDFVASALKRIGRLQDSIDIQIQPAPTPLHYRNRVIMRARADRNGLRVGYFKRASRDFVEVQTCAIADSAIQRWIDSAKKLAYPFNEEVSFKAEIQVFPLLENQVSVIVHPAHGQVAAGKTLVQMFGDLPEVCWVGLVHDVAKAPVLPLEEDSDLTYATSPGVFQQVNLAHNRNMRRQVLNILAEAKPSTVLDLFSGSGNFSLGISSARCKVTGIEFGKKSVEIGNLNAKNNQRADFAQYRSGDAVKILRELRHKDERFDVLITDPPREGMYECVPVLLDMAKAGSFREIIYISCDPATLARDLGKLTTRYQIASVTAFDFFPNTFHVETLVHLKHA